MNDKKEFEGDGYSKIHFLAEAGDFMGVWSETVKDPLAVHARDRCGCTPLHLAAANGHILAAQFLLNAGADVGALDGNDWTPLDVAIKRGHGVTAAMLRSRGGETRTVRS
jgi:ankyrin repeat protein